MPFLVETLNDHDYPVALDRLVQAAEAVLARHDVDPDASLSIVLETDEAVQTLNREHRGVDAPTDILSFPAEPLPDALLDELDEAELGDDAEAGEYLGDLVIAFPYAQRQAEQLQHPLSDSLALLVVHGTLHLLGYDHDTPAARAEMWEAQAEALRALHIDPAIVPPLEDSAH